MKALSIFIVSSFVLGAQAESAKRQTKTIRSENRWIVAVADSCTRDVKAVLGTHDFKKEFLPFYKISYQVCQEYKDYEVVITGNFWNQEESVIPESVSQPYYGIKEVTKEFVVRPKNPIMGFSGDPLPDGEEIEKANCEAQREILVQQMLLDASSENLAKCTQP